MLGTTFGGNHLQRSCAVLEVMEQDNLMYNAATVAVT